MGGRTAIATGLLAGMATGVVLLGVIVLAAPSPGGSVAAASPTIPPTASPGPTPPATAAPTTPAPAPSSTAPGGAFGVGAPAPLLQVAQLGGGQVDLASLRGKPVWVNFMATWCPSCRDELPLMAGYAARYADDGLVVLVVDVREDETTVDGYFRGLGVQLPVGLDVAGDAQKAWGAYALPVHFWIGSDGVVRDGALGGIGPDVMTAGLQKILPDTVVTAP
jgi:thiol-disulfide isomerase/thioredoxin